MSQTRSPVHPFTRSRILIVRTDRMGDLILSTPVIRSLRQAFPDAYLGMMVDVKHRELVEGNPDLNAVLLFDKTGSEKSVWGTVQFVRKLKAHQFETALILHSTNRVIWITLLAGIRRRIGYARRLSWALTDPVPYRKPEGRRHELEYNLDLLSRLGIPKPSWMLYVPVQSAQQEKIAVWLKGHGKQTDAPLVVLHPGASCPSKRWPADRFAQAGDQLIQQLGAQVVVVTGPDGLEQGQAVAQLMRQPPLTALGTLSLGELAALLKAAQILISNDSGPVHLASAMQTPVVSIFGRWSQGLSPQRWGPTGPQSRVLHKDIGCRPCLAHECPVGFRCLEAISVNEVLAAAKNLMGLHQSSVSVS
jgi:lipopolysaccharide heptosyltransferase II